jgi:hypothetical protein
MADRHVDICSAVSSYHFSRPHRLAGTTAKGELPGGLKWIVAEINS